MAQTSPHRTLVARDYYIPVEESKEAIRNRVWRPVPAPRRRSTAKAKTTLPSLYAGHQMTLVVRPVAVKGPVPVHRTPPAQAQNPC